MNVKENMSALLLELVLIVMCTSLTTEAAGCGWSGNMSGPGGYAACPYPMSSELCPATLTYQQLQSQGKLWPCPDYTRPMHTSTTLQTVSKEAMTYVISTLLHHKWVAAATEMAAGHCPISTGSLVPVRGLDVSGNYNGAPATKWHKNAGSDLAVNYVASYQ